VNLTAKVFGYEQKPNFAVENEAQIQDAPSVDFNQSVPEQPAQPQPAPQQPAPQPAPAG
jgi:LemA protein